MQLDTRRFAGAGPETRGDEAMSTNKQAVAYYRTSSATNVGENKDSLKRQQDAVLGYAKRHKLEVVREFYEPAVSGTDAVMDRPGFRDMLAYLLRNGAKTVLVENAGRFARDLVVQITGHDLLKAKGITLVPVDAPDHFQDETPTATMVRNILGSVSQFEKETLVARLRKARDRKSEALGRRIEGNPAWKDQGPPPAVVKAAKAIDARNRGPSGKRLPLRKVSARLAARGILAPSGKPYGAQSIALMLDRKPKGKP
jgi:DNA invertase Pin-like site-specific DNA recombinase